MKSQCLGELVYVVISNLCLTHKYYSKFPGAYWCLITYTNLKNFFQAKLHMSDQTLVQSCHPRLIEAQLLCLLTKAAVPFDMLKSFSVPKFRDTFVSTVWVVIHNCPGR